MAFTPINPQIAQYCSRQLRLIATDMDGTLTQQGKFTVSLFQVFEALQAKEIPLLIVTGRSAGWVSGLVNYLPIAGAIAENGGVFYPANSTDAVTLSSIPNLTKYRQQLSQVYLQLKTEFPQIQESADNRFRITDWTFDNQNLNISQLEGLENSCWAMGWGFTYSSVQCHIKPASQDKATALVRIMQDFFPQYALEQVLTVGDSPNDASLFNPDLFKLSVGVANICDYADELRYKPAYVTSTPEGEGFCELIHSLLNSET